MPLHKGHENLISFAAEMCDELRLVVCTQPGEPWVDLRKDWVSDYCKSLKTKCNIYVANIHKKMPQLPEESKEFWSEWLHELRFWSDVDYVFAGEAYGKELAAQLNAKFLPLNGDRTALYDVSGTYLRDSKVSYIFKHVSKFALRDLCYRIAIVGPESSGKTTLASELAKRFRTNFEVPSTFYGEYARSYLKYHGPDVKPEMMIDILKGNLAGYNNSRNNPAVFNFFDTDSLTTKIWFDFFNGKSTSLADEFINKEKYDLTIMVNDNIPFEPDPLRYGGDKRQLSLEHFVNIYKKYGREFIVLEQSSLSERMFFLVHYIEKAFLEKGLKR